MNRYLPLAIAFVLMVVTTIVQGRWSERWGPSISPEELAELAARLTNVPAEFGEWTSTDLESDPEQLEAARGAGSLAREYVNKRTNVRTQVFLICGTSRHIAVHTPDKCYVAAGYNLDEQPQKFTPEGVDSVGSMYTSPFTREDAIAGVERLRIFWTWNANGEWMAPATPVTAKIPLSQYRTLYKMYIITQIPTAREAPADNASLDFIKAFLPVANEALFGSGESAATSADVAQDDS